MNDAKITRLVMGQPTAMALGKPVAQSCPTAGQEALRWRAGRWNGTGARRVLRFGRAERRRGAEPDLVHTGTAPKSAARRWGQFAFAGLAALSLGAAIPLFVLAQREASTTASLPITQAPAPAAVRVVSAEYLPPQPSPAAAEPAALPIAAPHDGPLPEGLVLVLRRG